MEGNENSDASDAGGMGIAAWQAKLLPFMMTGLAVIAVLFFIGTFWNYVGLQSRLEIQEPEISVALERARNGSATPGYQDWYMRVVLEDRAMRGRHHQNTAVIEARTWTRFMGFITGMMMVMCGCIFILGKLEADFNGSIKAASGEGAMKTSSPGLVLAVAGTVLIAISLSVNVNVEMTDRPVYLAEAAAAAVRSPDVSLPPPSAPPSEIVPAPVSGPNVPLPPELENEFCKQAGRKPGCMSRGKAER